MNHIASRVELRDVTLRDGLQIESPLPLDAKLALLDAVVATGVREIEATAFVSPTKVPALADAADLAAELHHYPDVTFSALVASSNGARRAVTAGIGSIEYVVSASDGHSLANVGTTSAQAVDKISEIVDVAQSAGATTEVIIACAWDCPFDGPTDSNEVARIVERAVAAGADRLCIADTIGTTTPRRTAELIDRINDLTLGHPLGAHFHNTRGAGLASSYAAINAGITRLDASLGGLGGCPFAPGASGNIAMEDLVYMLRDSGICADVDLAAAIHGARVAADLVGHELPSALLRAGDRNTRV